MCWTFYLQQMTAVLKFNSQHRQAIASFAKTQCMFLQFFVSCPDSLIICEGEVIAKKIVLLLALVNSGINIHHTLHFSFEVHGTNSSCLTAPLLFLQFCMVVLQGYQQREAFFATSCNLCIKIVKIRISFLAAKGAALEASICGWCSSQS